MKFIFFLILVYFIYLGIKIIIKIFSAKEKSNKSYTTSNPNKPRKSSVDKKDIIDAKFEEIDSNDD